MVKLLTECYVYLPMSCLIWYHPLHRNGRLSDPSVCALNVHTLSSRTADAIQGQ